MQVLISIVDSDYGVKLSNFICEKLNIEDNKLYIKIEQENCYIYDKEEKDSLAMKITDDLMIYLPQYIIEVLKINILDRICLIVQKDRILVKKETSTAINNKSTEDILYEKNEQILENERKRVIKNGKLYGSAFLNTMLDFQGIIIECEDEEILEILNNTPNSLKILAKMWGNDDEVHNLRVKKLIEYTMAMKDGEK